MKTMVQWMVIAGLCLLGGAVQAQTPDLYSGEVAVVDETPATRDMALKQILGQVLVRVSGRSDVLSRAGAAQVLNAAASLVQQFRYRTETSGEGPDSPPRKYLRARFDAAALRRSMARHDLPVWLGGRPRVVLWVAIEESGGRHLFNVADDDRIRRLLQQRARARGMPLQLPLLDLEDQAAITAADIWSGYAPVIRRASARYPHDVVLTGKLRRQADGRWTADWGLWRGDEVLELRGSGEDLGEAIASGIDLAQDRLAVHPTARLGDGGGTTAVRIEGVRGLADYAGLMRMLGGIQEIGAVHVVKADPDRLLLKVRVEGGREALARLLAANPLLRELPDIGEVAPAGGQGASGGSPGQAELHYLLLGTDMAG